MLLCIEIGTSTNVPMNICMFPLTVHLSNFLPKQHIVGTADEPDPIYQLTPEQWLLFLTLLTIPVDLFLFFHPASNTDPNNQWPLCFHIVSCNSSRLLNNRPWPVERCPLGHNDGPVHHVFPRPLHKWLEWLGLPIGVMSSVYLLTAFHRRLHVTGRV